MDSRDRTILRLAVPALAALATTPLYVLVDTAIVGHLGTAPLGGLALAMTELTLLFSVTQVLQYGMTARVAQRIGRGDERAAVATAVQGVWVALGLGVVLGLAVVVGGRAVGVLLGGEGDVLDRATTYLRISAVWVPFELLVLVAIGYLRGVQDTVTPLVVAVASNVLNLVLEIVFVYGLDWGIAGSAWGTVLATIGASGWYGVVCARHVRRHRPPVRPDRDELRSLLRTGGHLSIRTGALLGTLSLATAVAARLGDDELAGHQIALQVETFLALVIDGLAIAGQALVGAALGAGDVDEARAVGRRLVQWGLWVGLSLAAAVVATSWVLPRLFSDDAAVHDAATTALMIVGVLQLPGAVVFVLDGVLLGASDDAFQGWSNLIAFAAFLPFAAAVLRWHGLGLTGVWLGLLAWMIARMVANAVRFAGVRWTAAVHR